MLQQTPRSEVFAAISGERDYQENLRAEAVRNGNVEHTHEIAAFLVYIESYLNEAKQISARDWSPQCNERVLDTLRKVTALGVACMEQHGVVPRKNIEVIDVDLTRHGFNLGG